MLWLLFYVLFRLRRTLKRYAFDVRLTLTISCDEIAAQAQEWQLLVRSIESERKRAYERESEQVQYDYSYASDSG